MALSTYAELQDSIAAFLNRDDLTSVIPDFITMAEARLNRDLRHWEMETRSTATFDEQYEPLPNDWQEMIRVNLVGESPIELVSQNVLLDMRERDNTAGKPRFYAITSGNIEFYPAPDDGYDGEILYYAKIPALSDSMTSNWLLAFAPDAYLYGALVHSAPYLQEDQRAQIWAALYQSAVDQLNAKSDGGKWGGTGLVMRQGRRR